jgi:hypothetical protein
LYFLTPIQEGPHQSASVYLAILIFVTLAAA